MRKLIVFMFCAALADPVWAAVKVPEFLVTRGHAHNDYLHKRPLLGALELGYCSIEVDVNLINGGLLVGHSPDRTDPRKTLESLYLNPLLDQARADHGKIYPQGPVTIQLLIEFKSDAERSYAALKPILERYSRMLTSFDKDGAHLGAVTVVITGHVPWDSLRRESFRYAAADTDQVSSDAPDTLAPLLSLRWGNFISWSAGRWIGRDIPAKELSKLRALVEAAHAKHRRIRFWDAPDNARAWSVLYDAGVDLINTDDLAGLQRFLKCRDARAR